MPPRPMRSRVPTTAQVVHGAAVHIVLKQDQPTGRTVQGTVQNVLTRGNHPRGIKVRLTDGRVGRVQMMGGPEASQASQTGGSSMAAQTSDAAPRQIPRSTADVFSHGRDVRLDDAFIAGPDSHNLPQQQIGLDAYIKPAKNKKKRGKNGKKDDEPTAETATTEPSTSPSAKCPVCGNFEGDEEAVSHHVATHFDP